MAYKIEIDIQQVEILASRGLNQEQIAAALGISERTLRNRKRDTAEVAAAIKKGKARAVSYVAGKLQKLIEQENLGAIIFFLKTQGGWKEHQVIESKDITDEKKIAEGLSSEALMRIAGIDEGLESDSDTGAEEESLGAEAR